MISSYDKHNIPLLRDGCADREGDVMLLLLLVLLSGRGRSKTGQSLELSDEVNGIVVAAHINGYLSPLLANIYLDKFDKEFEGRGVKVIRYADDIVLLAKSIRAAERLLGTSTSYLEKKLKLKVNAEKSRAVSVYSIRNFGFSALRWEETERVHISVFTQRRRRKPKKS